MKHADIQVVSTQRDDGLYNVEIVLTGTRSELEVMSEDLIESLQTKGILIPGPIEIHQIN